MANWWEEAPEVTPSAPNSSGNWWEDAPQVYSDGGGQAQESSAEKGDLLDALTQGVTWGFGSELSGAIQGGMSALTGGDFGETYDKASQNFQDNYEAYGERNPVTSTVAEIAGAAVAMALAAPVSLTTRVAGPVAKGLVAAGEGAAAGGIYGFASGNGPVEERMSDAAFGAGAGAIGGAAAPAIGRVAGRVAAPITQAIKARMPQVAGAGRGAVSRVAGAMGDDGLTDTAALAARRNELGPNANLYNAGENLRTQAETLVQRPGPQMRDITSAARRQTGGSADRIITALDGALGKADDMTKAFDDAIATRKSTANQLYGAAFRDKRPVDVTNVVSEIDKTIAPGVSSLANPKSGLRDDSISAVLGRVRSYFANAGNQRVDLQALHNIKMDLDDMIGSARRSGENAKSSALMGVQRELLKSMDAANTTYRTARQQFAGDIAVENAMRDGQEVFSRTMRADELRKLYAGMSQAERLAFKKGARDQIASMMNNAIPNLADNADAQAAWKRLQTNENLEKMRIILGDGPASTIEKALKSEWRISSDANTMLNNSATGRRLMSRDQFPDPNKAPQFPVAPSAYARLEALAGGAISRMGKGAITSRNKALNADAARLLGLPLDSPYIDDLMAARLRLAQGQVAGDRVSGLLGKLGDSAVMPSAVAASSLYNGR